MYKFNNECVLDFTDKRTSWRNTHLGIENTVIYHTSSGTVFSHDTDIQVVGLRLSSSSRLLTCRNNIVLPFVNFARLGSHQLEYCTIWSRFGNVYSIVFIVHWVYAEYGLYSISNANTTRQSLDNYQRWCGVTDTGTTTTYSLPLPCSLGVYKTCSRLFGSDSRIKTTRIYEDRKDWEKFKHMTT